MKIKTRRQVLSSFDLPTTWHEKIKGLNPNDRVYITTEKPVSEHSIEELEKLIEDKRVAFIIEQATTQLFEAIDILKAFGANIDTNAIGINRPELKIED